MRQWNVLTREAGMVSGSSPAAAPPTAGGVLRWNALALQAAGRTGLPQAARLLASLHTGMYNAWAAYDDDARQTAQGVAVRLPRAERDAASKASAMGHAAHGVLTAALPDGAATCGAHLRALGLDPAAAASPFSPAGIGRTQAAAMLDAWRTGAGGAAPAHADRSTLLARWYGLAAWLSVRDRHDEDQDVLLFFMLGNALAETVAPGAAAAEALRRFTGSDHLGTGAPGHWVTFTEVAGQEVGQEAGRQAGARVFERARRCWTGRL